MKLVYVTASFPYGAGEAYFESELEELVRQGCDVLVVPRSHEGRPLHAQPGHAWAVRKARLVSPAILLKAARVCLRKPSRVWSMLRLVSVDRSHLLRNVMVLPKSLWLAGLADEWGADHIHAHWASTTSTMAMIAAGISCGSWSFTAHRWDIEDGNLMDVKLGDAAFGRAISESGRELLAAQVRPDDCRKLKVVHMGVAVPDAPAKRRESGQARVRKLICVGHLNEGKGHDDLFKAVAALKSAGNKGVALDVAGDGPLRSRLEARVDALGLRDQVRFLGHVSHEQLLCMYAGGQIDVAVLASEFEGIPVALMEAMAYGIPVVATRVGGIPELCGDGSGVLVPPKDVRALTEALASLLGDETELARLAESGRQKVLQEFSAAATVSVLISLILLSEQGCADDRH